MNAALAAVRHSAQALRGTPRDYDALVERAADARFVLLGEASHGTHEFYRERAEITKRLICELGFEAVAVEADWPDAYRVGRYVRAAGTDRNADAALGGFCRFPTWMWRNTEVRAFVAWLRAHNDARDAGAPSVGFYGLDLYSLHTSIAAVLAYLDKSDPEAARRARHRYACFEAFGEDTQAYGYAAGFGLGEDCEDEVVGQLVELRHDAARYLMRDGSAAEEEFFYAEQNARLVKNAERYYRVMFDQRVSSWNLRDRHMAETLAALVEHLQARGRAGKVVVWAHNSHLGDARATEMAERGELNLGQLVRQAHHDAALLVGFSTHHGSVTATSDWDEPAQNKRVRAGLPGSFEALFHAVGEPNFALPLRGDEALREALREPRLQRAIGVIYRPETERQSHYFHTRLPAQFDLMLHFDRTRALEPLERGERWDHGEPPETYPSGI